MSLLAFLAQAAEDDDFDGSDLAFLVSLIIFVIVAVWRLVPGPVRNFDSALMAAGFAAVSLGLVLAL